MFTQTDFVIGCLLTAFAVLYVWFPTVAPAESELPLDPAAQFASDLIDSLHKLIAEFKVEGESTNLNQFQVSFIQLSQLDMGDMRFRLVWPKSRVLKNELDDLFNGWNEAGDQFRKKVESLPKLTVNTAVRWRDIKDDLLKFEIKSADYDRLYGIVTRSNEIVFKKKAIALQEALQTRATQTLPVFPEQFPSEIIEMQIQTWCEQVKDMNIDPVLKQISVDSAESQLRQLKRLRELQDD